MNHESTKNQNYEWAARALDAGERVRRKHWIEKSACSHIIALNTGIYSKIFHFNDIDYLWWSPSEYDLAATDWELWEAPERRKPCIDKYPQPKPVDAPAPTSKSGFIPGTFDFAITCAKKNLTMRSECLTKPCTYCKNKLMNGASKSVKAPAPEQSNAPHLIPGTYEWAIPLAKEGLPVRRASWETGKRLMDFGGIRLYLVENQSLGVDIEPSDPQKYTPSFNDLTATDWEICEDAKIEDAAPEYVEPPAPEPSSENRLLPGTYEWAIKLAGECIPVRRACWAETGMRLDTQADLSDNTCRLFFARESPKKDKEQKFFCYADYIATQDDKDATDWEICEDAEIKDEAPEITFT